jgi:TolA-binding protein
MAADKKPDKANAAPLEFSEADKKKARAWFAKAADCRERRDYDYAIECYITGLTAWPEAVDEGHMPLSSLAVQRRQAGGSKPGMMEGLKRPMIGRNAKQCMLNAEYLLAKDPNSSSYLDGLLKNANKAGLLQTVKWITPAVFDSLRKDKKPNKGRFRAFRDILIEAAEKAEAQGDAPLACWLLEQAVNSVEYVLARLPGDEDLRNEQRDLAGRLAILKGKYQEAESFRESLHDADKQKVLHDTERLKQGEETYESLVAAARREYEANPGVPAKIFALVDVLARRETREAEAEAVKLLMDAHARSSNYNFKQKADDIRLRQLQRQARLLGQRANASGSAEDQQQYRLASMERSQVQLEVFRERVAQYPTDLRLKYLLGRALYEAREFDEAIPMLQAAQTDPRSRHQCQFLMGRAFFEKGSYAQAAAVLTELRDAYELTDDLSKDIMYWLARSLEADGRTEEARATYGRLLRQDYNYAQGDARKRLEALK